MRTCVKPSAFLLHQRNLVAEPMIKIVIVLTSVALVAGIMALAVVVVTMAAVLLRLVLHVVRKLDRK